MSIYVKYNTLLNNQVIGHMHANIIISTVWLHYIPLRILKPGFHMVVNVS